jgi:hypothetical protein
MMGPRHDPMRARLMDKGPMHDGRRLRNDGNGLRRDGLVNEDLMDDRASADLMERPPMSLRGGRRRGGFWIAGHFFGIGYDVLMAG